MSARAPALVASPANHRWLSVASIWEMAIKLSLGKLNLVQPFGPFLRTQLSVNRIEVLRIELDHAAAVATLPFHHRDPFDRLLAAQSQLAGLPIVSNDLVFDAYWRPDHLRPAHPGGGSGPSGQVRKTGR